MSKDKLSWWSCDLQGDPKTRTKKWTPRGHVLGDDRVAAALRPKQTLLDSQLTRTVRVTDA